MPDWDRINLRKRWEILQGQTLNMAWQEILSNNSEDFEEKLKALKDKYPRLLEVNTKLVSGEVLASPLVPSGDAE